MIRRFIIALLFLVISVPAFAATAQPFDAPGLDILWKQYRTELGQSEIPDADAAALAEVAGEASLAVSKWDQARKDFEKALRNGADGFPLRRGLAQALTESAHSDSARQQAAALAYAAYQVAQDDNAKAEALSLIGQALARVNGRQDLAETALRQSLDIKKDTKTRIALNKLVEAFSLSVERLSGVADKSLPEACVDFSTKLPIRSEQDYADFIRIHPRTDIGIRATGDRLCLTGLVHGQEYVIAIRKGLRAANGAVLRKTVSGRVALADRSPSVSFRQSGYVLPATGSRGLPLVSVNVNKADLSLFRIIDRNLVQRLRYEDIGDQLSHWDMNRLKEQDGELVWEGQVDIDNQKNQDVITALPLGEVITERKPGVYVLVASDGDVQEIPRWEDRATQWFVISDIGLLSFQGHDGLRIIARSLATAEPLADVKLSLLSQNNMVLGDARTDSEGSAQFAPGLLRGSLGRSPITVMAEGAEGDFTFLDLTKSAFDLSDRGVSGKPHPGPVSAFLYPERGIYRPGETAELTVLTRDAAGAAVTDLPLTLRLFRPDGEEARRLTLEASASGAYHVSLPFNRASRTGRWTVAAHLDPEADPVGTTGFLVDDFVPARVTFDATPEEDFVLPGGDAAVDILAEYLYGAPANAHSGVGVATIERDPAPFSDYADYQFGLVQEQWNSQSEDIGFPETDDQGRTRVFATVPAALETSFPLRLKLHLTLFEESGRPVNRILSLPIRKDSRLLGIKPAFEGQRVRYGTEAQFDIVSLSSDGQPEATSSLGWELYRERHHYTWYQDHRGWHYEVSKTDALEESGTFDSRTDGPSRLSFRRDWGHYRLEVFDPQTGAASSFRFAYGWSSTPGATAEATPDRMGVTLDKRVYRAGETAKVKLEAPFAGKVVLAVLSDRVHSLQRLTIPEGGTIVDLPVGEDWGVGAYVTATALRPAGAEADHGPNRAIGLSWLALDTSDRTLSISMEMPEVVLPRQKIEVPVQVAGLSGAGQAWMTLAAVDEGILQLTGYETPNPEDHYFTKRRLAVDLRDLYGQLIDGRQGQPAELRSGGDADGGTAPPAKRTTRTVSLFSGLVQLDKAGRATIPLDLPDFNGRLRLMAVAFDGKALGHGEVPLIVRDPVVTSLSLPRFLAPDDEAQIKLTLANTDAPEGDFFVSLQNQGAISLDPAAPQKISLTRESREALIYTLKGDRLGDGKLALSLSGPEDWRLTRSWEISVRPATTRITRTRHLALEPGESLRLDDNLVSDFRPQGRHLGLTLSIGPNFNIAGTLEQLDRYPYGCLEQTTSRALPLLYLSSVAADLGIGTSDDKAGLKRRLDQAIDRVLSMQRAEGSFGLWSAASPAEPWLTAYVLDFLTRARDLGYVVDDFAYRRGLDWLARYVNRRSFDDKERVVAAYAHYVLAVSGVGSVRDARQFHAAVGTHLPNRLATAQLAAALAVYGEKDKAQSLFRAASRDRGTSKPDSAEIYYASYGSDLRDWAALTSFAATTDQPWDQVDDFGQHVATLMAQEAYTSTQEKAWLLLAAHAMIPRQKQFDIKVNGRTVTADRSYTLLPSETELTSGLRITNASDRAMRYALTTAGHPYAQLPAEQHGYTIERSFYDTQGNKRDPSTLTQNDLVVVVLQGKGPEDGSKHRSLVIDLLPAGLELENASIGEARSASDLHWLPALTPTRYTELRDDRFVAALDLSAAHNQKTGFTLAYLARAVTPGTYTLPASMIEDMYKPALNARSTPGQVTVLPRQ